MADTYLLTTGSTFARPKTGITRIDRIYVIPGPATADDDDPWDVLNEWEPSKNPFDLPIVDRKASKDTDGDWLLTISNEGVVDDAALDPSMEIDFTDVQVPFETLENFDELAKKWGPPVTDDDSQFKGWPPKIKDSSGQTIKNPYYGFNHVEDGNLILRVMFGTRDFQNDLLKGLQKIDPNPLVPEGQGAVLAQLLEEGETFLKKSLKAQYRGNAWMWTLEYWKGKWAVDVYTRKN